MLSKDLEHSKEECHGSIQLRSNNHQVSHLQCENPSQIIQGLIIHHVPSHEAPQTWCEHYQSNPKSQHVGCESLVDPMSGD
jgi:hypothetical protein